MSDLDPSSLKNFHFLSQPELSPSGNKVAFVVKEVNKKGDGYDSNIWIHDFEEGKRFQLTTSGADEKFTWKNEEELLFVSGRESEEEAEKSDFFSIDVTGGEARKSFELSHKVQEFSWESGKLVYSAPVDIVEEEDEDEDGPDCIVMDEIPFWANGKGFTNKKRTHLFSFEPEEGESVELTPGSVDVEGFAVNETRLAFVGKEYSDVAPIDNAVYLASIEGEGSPPERLTEEGFRFGLVEFNGPESLYLTMTDMENAGLNQNQRLYTYDIQDRVLSPLDPEWNNSFQNRVLTDVRLGQGQNSTSADGDFYFVSTINSSSQLRKADSSGNITELTGPVGSVDDFDAVNGREVFVRLTGEDLQELYTLTGEGEERKITSFNEKAYPEGAYSPPESFKVENDGTTVESWLIRPRDFDPDSYYPTILEVHGGPKAVYGEVFFHEMQLLANKGYVVIFSNPRGSDGRGDNFSDIRGRYGKEDFEDLMKVVDTALERYSFIDADKLGVTGGSYGGFMTNWIIGHTDRFSAAVSCRSISNWISKFNTTDIGYFFVADQQGGDPWTDHDKLWEQSPLKYADNVSTPTLFIHSREDYRCWEAEGLQMFTALKYHGVPSRLCLFEGENHELSRGGNPKNRIKRLEEMVDWFDKYLK